MILYCAYWVVERFNYVDLDLLLKIFVELKTDVHKLFYVSGGFSFKELNRGVVDIGALTLKFGLVHRVWVELDIFRLF
jgi:hypothetical protein